MRAHTFTTTTPTITQMFPLDLRQEFFRRVIRPSRPRRIQKPTNRERSEAREFDILGLSDRWPHTWSLAQKQLSGIAREQILRKNKEKQICAICGHPHLDYVNDEPCASCGCDGTDTPGEPRDE